MKKLVFFLAIVSIAVTSCLKSGISTEELKAITVKDTVSMQVGDVYQVPYTLTPADYNTGAIVWIPADTTVVSVTQTGKLTAKKTGTTKLSVTNILKTVWTSCLITVSAKPMH